MRVPRLSTAALLMVISSGLAGSALAQQTQQQPTSQQSRPNILFIMGDDIGWMQPSIYHRGLMVGDTPNTTVPCRAAPPGAMRFSPVCTHCEQG